jgi:predicted transcriptional regulator
MNGFLTKEQFSGYTYQHAQGCMLISLNKVSSELKLSHAEYRIMCTLIGYWNKQHGKAYPTTRQLVKDCCMSNTTLHNGLKRLIELNLIVIVKDSRSRRQNYYINQKKFFNPASSNHATPPVTSLATPCSSTHDNKTNREKLIEQTSKHDIKLEKKPVKRTNDDVSSKTQNIAEYKAVLQKLESWGVSDNKKIIHQHGTETIQKLIKTIEKRKPDNAGAYLRSLLNSSGHITSGDNTSCTKAEEIPLINQMLKYKHWRHIPTGKILQALPDVGTHLLVKYWKDEEMVTFIENGFTDKIIKFMIINQQQ